MLRIRLFLLSLKDSTNVNIAGMGSDLRPLRQNESSEQGGFDCRLGHSVSRGQKPVVSNLPSVNADSLTSRQSSSAYTWYTSAYTTLRSGHIRPLRISGILWMCLTNRRPAIVLSRDLERGKRLVMF